MKLISPKLFIAVLAVIGCCVSVEAQPLPEHLRLKQNLNLTPVDPEAMNFSSIVWNKDGHLFTNMEPSGAGFEIAQYDPSANFARKVLVSSNDLTPQGAQPLEVESYTWYPAKQQMLLFTNSKKVWRANTRGDFWVLNVTTKKLVQLGKGLPSSSLQFAKISDDGTKAAYVSKHNIYVEDLQSGNRKQLTTDGTDRIINGTLIGCMKKSCLS